MAYDSETYGQSPFGNPKKKPEDPLKNTASKNAHPSSAAPKAVSTRPTVDDGLDLGPGELEPTPSPSSTPPDTPPAQALSNIASKLGLSKFGLGLGTANSDLEDLDADSGGADAIAGRTTGKASRRGTSAKSATGKRSTSTKAKKTTRKSKKAKAAEAAQAEAEAAEAAVVRRFQEEDQSAYFSLIYKTGISALVWAVLMLLRHELSEDADAVINIIINPLLVAGLSLLGVIALTFWLRRLVNDLARHTQKLHADAEMPDGKNYRPTLEIVGDALEYNPKLRRQISFFFDAASTLICTLVSYLVTSAIFQS